MPKPNVKEAILDWFDRNPTAKTRTTPLAKALKLDPSTVAVICGNLAEPGGPLIRCKVSVKPEDRPGGGPKEQWEYCKAMSAAPAPVKPYVPPVVPRRPTGVITKAPENDNKNPIPPLEEVDTPPIYFGAGRLTGDFSLKYLAWHSLGEKYGCNNPDELQAFIDELEKKRVDALQAEQEASSELAKIELLKAETLLLKAKARRELGGGAEIEGGRVEHPDVPTIRHARLSVFAGYLVTRASKPPRRFTKFTNAQANALSAARADGLAEVFALHPVGKAVRGAEWKDR